MEVKPAGKVLLIENFASDFYKARVPLCHFLKHKGWDVSALVPEDEYLQQIRKEGITAYSYTLSRKDKGIFQLIKLVREYRKVIQLNQMEIIHSFRFQPNLINVLANLFNKRKVILHITGLGIAFSNNSLKYLILRVISQIIFQIKLLRANVVFVQNEDDAKDIWFGQSIWRRKIHIVNGSGVDTTLFNQQDYNRTKLRQDAGVAENEVVFTLVTRLIWEKGIRELTEVFDAFKNEERKIKLWIIGWSDKDNPRHVDEGFIRSFDGHPVIAFLNRRENVRELLAMSDVFIYPSYYREGIPRSVLEALSMGLPVITSDMPGCKLTVEQGKNGYLINPKSIDELKLAVQNIISSDQLRNFGLVSRKRAEDKFANNIIFSAIEKYYR